MIETNIKQTKTNQAQNPQSNGKQKASEDGKRRKHIHTNKKKKPEEEKEKILVRLNTNQNKC